MRQQPQIFWPFASAKACLPIRKLEIQIETSSQEFQHLHSSTSRPTLNYHWEATALPELKCSRQLFALYKIVIKVVGNFKMNTKVSPSAFTSAHPREPPRKEKSWVAQTTLKLSLSSINSTFTAQSLEVFEIASFNWSWYALPPNENGCINVH